MVNNLFDEKIFPLINTKDQENKLCTFDIVIHMLELDVHRHKLAEDRCFEEVFEKMNSIASNYKDPNEMKVLEKMS